MKCPAIGVLIACVAFGSSAHAQSLVLNGSFEAPVSIPNVFQQVAPTDWTTGTNACTIANLPTTFPAQDGQQFVVLGPNPTYYLSQDITVVNAGFYALTWYDSAPPTNAAPAAEYNLTVTGSALSVMNQDYSISKAVAAWAQQSTTLVLTPGTYTLQFESLTNNVFLDNVALVQTVPEPSTLALVSLVGLAGVLVSRRKQ